MTRQEQPPRLAPASQFSTEELTNAYNQARVDYLVPMSMTPAHFASYVKMYDIDLGCSRVALDDGGILGLAMLGVRSNHTWVTRLGVLPTRRRSGTAETLVQALLDETRRLGCNVSLLEVIMGNLPAHSLFQKMGFQDTRELLVLRRPPGPMDDPPGLAYWLGQSDASSLLDEHPVRPAWTNEIATFLHAGDVQALSVNLGDDGHGWIVFRYYHSLLTHFVLRTEQGDANLVARALLGHLYTRFPHAETYIENIPTTDEHYPAMQRLGFVEVFRRMEMEWNG